jgi:hypothetical protein
MSAKRERIPLSGRSNANSARGDSSQVKGGRVASNNQIDSARRMNNSNDVLNSAREVSQQKVVSAVRIICNIPSFNLTCKKS